MTKLAMTERLRRDYLVHYCIWLSELQVPHLCEQIRSQLLAVVRDKRYAYRDYFTEKNIDTWLTGEKSVLENTPSTAQTIYDILETLNVVGKTFKDIEAIDLSDKASSINIIGNTMIMLTNDFPLVYDRLQNLNHSSSGIGLLLSPLLEQIYTAINITSAIKDKALSTGAHAIHHNEDAFQALLPQKTNGLAFLSRTIILSSFLLRELTELIERGDTKIDFNPTSSEILKLEKRFNEELANLQKANALIHDLGPMGRLAQLLYGEISKILNETIPLTTATHTRALQAFETLKDEILAAYRSEVEQLEENIGLNPGVLTKPFETERQRLLHALDAHIAKLSTLPNEIKQLAKMCDNPMNAVAGVAFNAAAQGVYKINCQIQNLISNPAGRNHVSNTSPQDENIPPILSDVYDQNVQSLRLKRLVALQTITEDESIEKDAKEFFEIIAQYNQQYGTKEIQFLPEKVKLALKKAYLHIQPYFARKYPKMDIDIVNGLSNPGTMPAIAKHSPSSLDAQVLNKTAQFTKQAYEWCTFFDSIIPTTVTYGISLGLLATYAVETYFIQKHNNQLQHILDCKNTVIIEIRQSKQESLFKRHLIEQRFKEELKLTDPALDEALCQLPHYEQYVRECQIQKAEYLYRPLQALGHQFQYKTLFGRLKESQCSKSITSFENKTLYPFLQRILNDKEIISLFGIEGDMCAFTAQTPYETFYKDTEQVVVYKKLLNAFYHLKTCLVSLEKVDDYGEPAAWNIYGKVVVAKDMLLPILTNGLGACFDVVEALKNPLFASIAEEGLSTIRSLDRIFPMIRAFKGETVQQNPEMQASFNAKDAWLQQQAQYDAMLNKTLLSTPLVIPVTEELQPEEAEETSPLTVDSVALWISKSAERFKKEHECLVAHQYAPLNEEEINTNAIQTANQFFDELSHYVHRYVYKNKVAEQGKASQLVQQIREFRIGSTANTPTAANQGSFWTLLDNIKDTLNLLDIINTVISETYNGHTDDIFSQIKYLHHIIGFKLLSLASDIEFKLGLKKGLVMTPVQQYLDTVCEKLLRQFSNRSAYLYEFWADNALFDLREHYELRQVIQLRLHHLTENYPITNNLKNAFAALNNLQNTFPDDSSLDFNALVEFSAFCEHYTTLQPFLFQCDKQFDQAGFLKGLHNHRPDLVKLAIQKIIQTRSKLEDLFKEREHHTIHGVNERRARFDNLRTNERQNHNTLIFKKSIHQILFDRYATILGDYLPLISEVVEKTMLRSQENEAWTDLTALLRENHSANIFRERLEHLIDEHMRTHFSTTGRLYQTLFKLKEFDKQFDLLNQAAWNKASDKSNYSFCLFPTNDPTFKLLENQIAFSDENGVLYYRVIDLQGEVVKDTLPPDFLEEHCINLSKGLDVEVIKTQLQPKANEILNETSSRGHTQVANPCLYEKMNYVKSIHASENNLALMQEKLKETPAENQEIFYHELYLSESRRLRILLNYRKKRLEKYDQLISAFDTLNELEAFCQKHDSEENKAKIILIKSLKNILKDETSSLQVRLNQLALKLTDDHYKTILTHESQTFFLSRFISPFMRWTNKEQELLDRLYSPLWQGAKLLLALNKIEASLIKNQRDVSDINWEKLQKVRTLKCILQDPKKPHAQCLNEFFEHLSTSNCLSILAKETDGLPHFIKQFFSLLGFSNYEKEALTSLCKPMSDFFAVNLILNDMEQYTKETLVMNEAKRTKIKHLKIIMEGLGSQEARLQHLYKEFAKPENQTILASHSDIYLMRLGKKLFSYLTGWKPQEEKLLFQLNHKLSFFKLKNSLADSILQARMIEPENPHEPLVDEQPNLTLQ